MNYIIVNDKMKELITDKYGCINPYQFICPEPRVKMFHGMSFTPKAETETHVTMMVDNAICFSSTKPLSLEFGMELERKLPGSVILKEDADTKEWVNIRSGAKTRITMILEP